MYYITIYLSVSWIFVDKNTLLHHGSTAPLSSSIRAVTRPYGSSNQGWNYRELGAYNAYICLAFPPTNIKLIILALRLPSGWGIGLGLGLEYSRRFLHECGDLHVQLFWKKNISNFYSLLAFLYSLKLTSSTIKAGSSWMSDEMHVNLFVARISLVKSVCSHHRSSSFSKNKDFPSSGMSTFTLQTLSGTVVKSLLDKFNWPDFLACLRIASGTSPFVCTWLDIVTFVRFAVGVEENFCRRCMFCFCFLTLNSLPRFWF